MNGLVFFSNLDNRSVLGENDTFVRDLSKNGNNVTPAGGNNITWTPNGKYNGAYKFSNSGCISYMNSSSSTFGINGTNITISAWFKAYNLYNSTGGIVKSNFIIGKDSGGSSRTFQFNLYNGQPNVNFFSNSTDLKTAWGVAGDKRDGNWHSMIATYDGNNIVVYVDGVGVTTSWIGRTLAGTTQPILIGAYRTTSGSTECEGFFNGTIDDIMIWNRSFSYGEAQLLYKSQQTRYNETDWGFAPPGNGKGHVCRCKRRCLHSRSKSH